MIDVGQWVLFITSRFRKGKGTFSTGPGLKDRESFYPGNFLVPYLPKGIIHFVCPGLWTETNV